MKLVQIYFIGVFLAIALLAASTFWQYQQFQGNVRNLTLSIPSQFGSGMPNFNNQLGQLAQQIQTQNQNNSATTTAATKEFSTGDGALRFNYSADWQEGISPQASGSGVIFYATKTTNQSSAPTINFLTVKEFTAKTDSEVMSDLEQEIRNKGSVIKLTKSELIISNKKIPFAEFKYNVNDSVSGINVNIKIENAAISIKDKTYSVVTFSQGGDVADTQESEKIFSSIRINDGNDEVK